MKKRTDLIEPVKVTELVMDLETAFSNEYILVDTREKDGYKYQVQIVVTRCEDDFLEETN